MVLALDISTSMTGFAIVDRDGAVRVHGYVDLRKEKSFVKKVGIAKEGILSATKGYTVKVLAVEKNLQAFRRGFSSASTLDTLARFNGALSYAIASSVGVPLFNLDVNEVRRKLGIKIQKEKICGLPTKEQVKRGLDGVLAESGQKIQWGTKVLKSGPRKGLAVTADGVYDEVDAIVVGLAYLKMYG